MLKSLFACAAIALATSSAHAVEPGPLPLLANGLVSVQLVDGKTRLPLEHFGSAGGPGYVVGNVGRAYRVVVTNRTAGELLVVPSVDGVNVLSGKTASASQVGYIVPAYGRVDVDGWRKSEAEVAAFYFSNPDDSYAARTGRPDNVGVIGLAVFKSAQPIIARAPEPDARVQPFDGRSLGGAPGAPVSPPAMAPMSKPIVPSLGTAHGERLSSRVTYREFARESESPNQVVTVEYDSLPNLMARGIIAPHQPVARHPFPADGFVPDPPTR